MSIVHPATHVEAERTASLKPPQPRNLFAAIRGFATGSTGAKSAVVIRSEHATPGLGRLVILPTLRIGTSDSGRLILTKKFIEGVRLYRRLWDGPVSVMGLKSVQRDENLDQVELPSDVLPFEVTVQGSDFSKLPEAVNEDDVLLMSLESLQCGIPEMPEIEALAKVYVSEYSVKTRAQIARHSTRNPLKMVKRMISELFLEVAFRRAVALADGIQCNGTPTYRAYRHLNRNAMLFFDSRVSAEMLASEATVRARNRNQNAPLRLIYSGRLNEIKGTDHLIEVASELNKLGVDFELTIWGGGSLEVAMKRRIEALGLGERVKLAGVLDFKTELIPYVKENADLFVCCHRQGDPSCTYLETMSCGVPIVGYDNEAFRGIVELSGSGWITPMDNPREMARQIARLGLDRANLLNHSLVALGFASQHTSERTFERRTDHLRETAEAKRRRMGF